MFPDTPVAGSSAHPDAGRSSPSPDDDLPQAPSRSSLRASSASFPSTLAERGHVARSLLCGTSASHLVSDDMTPDDMLPSPQFYEPATSSPDWSIGVENRGDSAEVRALKAVLRKVEQRKIEVHKGVRRAQATMALQTAHLKKVNKKFSKKTKKRKDVRTAIFKSGNGAVITSDDAHRLIHEDAENWEKAAAEKTGRATQHAMRKADKEAVKKRNAQLRADYVAKKKQWEEACNAIRAANPGKKRLQLPPRPEYPFRKGSKAAQGNQEDRSSPLEGDLTSTGSASGKEDDEEGPSRRLRMTLAQI
ncbi:hypothetical protein AURDEDRAFT_162308 [Auricularia subglabra TFB-10046 SS5]|nr:hypothetical protein AURDEDRAFT_162308 [Auricularia subglabra TFB-10046 SS5]